MKQPDGNALHADLVAAFFHPPRIIICGFQGSSDDEVTIVSHVELWPWRTVVRGSVTRPGSIGYNEGVSDPKERVRRMSWFQDWSLVDDLDTEYHQVGAGREGDGFCSDTHVSFRTAVPAEATQLTIFTTGSHRIEVPL